MNRRMNRPARRPNVACRCAGMIALLLTFASATWPAGGCGGPDPAGRPAPPVRPAPPRPAAPLIVGTGRADLTLPPGRPLAGFGRDGPYASGFWVRPETRAICVDAGAGGRVVLVSCDLYGIPAGMADEVARSAARFVPSLGREQLVIAATGTRHGPSGYFGTDLYDRTVSADPGFDPPARAFFVSRVCRAVVEACNGAVPATLHVGATDGGASGGSAQVLVARAVRPATQNSGNPDTDAGEVLAVAAFLSARGDPPVPEGPGPATSVLTADAAGLAGRLHEWSLSAEGVAVAASQPALLFAPPDTSGGPVVLVFDAAAVGPAGPPASPGPGAARRAVWAAARSKEDWIKRAVDDSGPGRRKGGALHRVTVANRLARVPLAGATFAAEDESPRRTDDVPRIPLDVRLDWSPFTYPEEAPVSAHLLVAAQRDESGSPPEFEPADPVRPPPVVIVGVPGPVSAAIEVQIDRRAREATGRPMADFVLLVPRADGFVGPVTAADEPASDRPAADPGRGWRPDLSPLYGPNTGELLVDRLHALIHRLDRPQTPSASASESVGRSRWGDQEAGLAAAVRPGGLGELADAPTDALAYVEWTEPAQALPGDKAPGPAGTPDGVVPDVMVVVGIGDPLPGGDGYPEYHHEPRAIANVACVVDHAVRGVLTWRCYWIDPVPPPTNFRLAVRHAGSPGSVEILAFRAGPRHQP